MTKHHGKEWEADLDPRDIGRPGSYAVDRALEQAHAVEEEMHWKQSFRREPYCEPGRDFDYYAPAYRIGYEGCARYHGREFDDVERELQSEYERRTDASHPHWNDARAAARAAWDRAKRLFGDRR
jgi:hypothetical protein